ncbi:MAG: bifunctional phosphoribosylaminoimidazolecarboxamide formyltransferase/IMP cyclohydrolase [Acetobacteraceae bacterium]|nr:bifunctional phosphoribosylaminoimidazolecarboxamide formyltransferase/IMP cyclohydrolase [Acetobacteraceae bacterium]
MAAGGGKERGCRVVRTALLSVSDRTGICELAAGLCGLGWRVASTGGTAQALREAGIPVVEVSRLTGFPEILGGRVKTLHPAVHGGILAKRQEAAHLEELARHGIDPIDLVAVNLYPFRKATADPGVGLDAALESLDIGGPALIRAAAKNFRGVIVLTDPQDYGPVLEALRRGGDLDPAHRLRLAAGALAHTAQYDALAAEFLAARAGVEAGFPAVLCLRWEKVADLRYGENPHQRAALYADSYAGGWSLARARLLHGKELSYNNLNDAQAALALAFDLTEPAAVVVKHATPCGAACAPTLAEAFCRARDSDPVSAFGGVVGLNRQVDGAAAEALGGTFLEVVAAPGFSAPALERLTRKRDLRLVEVAPPDGVPAGSGPGHSAAGPCRGPGPSAYHLRPLAGGVLAQEPDRVHDPPEAWRLVAGPAPGAGQLRDLAFAWRVVAAVRSNAVVLAKGLATVGVGGGQTSRIGAARIALEQAGERARGAVLASDGFFPFPDVVEAAAQAGVSAVVQPGGAARDQEVIAAAGRAGITMLFTGVRHFTH